MNTTKSLILAGSLFGFASLVSAQTIIDIDFGTGYTDGALDGQNSWNSQTQWTISSGNAIAAPGYGRARSFGDFRVDVGETVVITLTDFVFSGADTGNAFSFGFQAKPEHSGSQMPQVAAELSTAATSLSIGGATDTAYEAGVDVLDIELSFTRLAGNGAWDVSTVITNKTDVTSFLGTSASTNIAGQTGDNTGLVVSEWLDADDANQLLFGMRGINAGTGDRNMQLGGVSLVVIPEPSVYALLGGVLALTCVVVRRRR